MVKPTRLDEVIRRYTKERAAARWAAARPQTNRRDYQAEVAMATYVHEAKALKEAGKFAEARKALELAEFWRKKAGIP